MKKIIGNILPVLMFAYYGYTRWEVASHVSKEDVPSFTADMVRGEGSSLSKEALQGRFVVLNFWATWCSVCKKETPVLKDLSARLARKGGHVIGVASFDEVERVRASKKLKDLSFDMAMDSDGQVAAAFGIHALPQTVVVGPRGKVLYRVKGQLRKESIEKIVKLF